MIDSPRVAAIAALLGDPARANMLTGLMDGRALTVSELAGASGVALSTASGHLSKLEEAGLVLVEKQGRHRYFRLSGHDVAAVLESLMNLAQRTGAVPVRTGPRDAAMREARICYDHLAGRRAVDMMAGFVRRGWLAASVEPALTESGRLGLARMGVDTKPLETRRRPLCRACLDWSERRSHLGGSLGAALLDHVLAQGWARRGEGRIVTFSPAGGRAFDQVLGCAALPD